MANDFLHALNPFARRGTTVQDTKRDLRNFIAPVQLQRLRQDILSWRDVLNESENVWFPHRVKAQRLYNDTALNGHIAACMERRNEMTLLRKWDFVDAKGETVDSVCDIFLNRVAGQSQAKAWFDRFNAHALNAIYYGYSLIALGDIVNDEFPNLDIVKRWNVSPDRMNVTNFTYSISGARFDEGETANWHAYIKTPNDIGTSPAGYGLLYKVAIYEIYLRNILGYNADFVELYSQPYRVGKTTKTNEDERAELEAAIQQMGSSGYALIDPSDEIVFLETALGGTGWQGYDNFEQRLEKKVSKVILGHADALDSVPGKLGSSKEESPAEKALKDKQTKDGVFLINAVNGELIPRMRKLGFLIPDDVRAVLKNDAEIMQTNNAVISQAVEMKKGGLQMDADYFVEKTGIKVSAISTDSLTPPSFSSATNSIKNKLDTMYGKNKCTCGNH